MSDPLIQLRGITKTYDADQRTGIRPADIAIHRGEFVAIVGPSGAGKSTLLNILGLLDRADAGEYFLDGRDVGDISERERDRLRSTFFGFVFQSAFVLGDESALQNAALGLRIRGTPPRTRTELALRALSLLNVRHRALTAGRLLSGGERQRLAIARAIATQPEVILADEPTGNLDGENGRNVLEHLEQLHRSGITVVLITHDVQIASRARRRIHVVDGVVREEPYGGSPARLPSAPPPTSSGRPRVLGDDFADAISAMSHRFVRTLMLIVAFALGIAGLITSIGVTESASAQVSERLSRAALDEVRITLPGGAELLAPGDRRLSDWVDEATRLPHVVGAGWVASAGVSSAHIRRWNPDEPEPAAALQLVAASPSYLELVGAKNTSVGGSVSLVEPSVTNTAWIVGLPLEHSEPRRPEPARPSGSTIAE